MFCSGCCSCSAGGFSASLLVPQPVFCAASYQRACPPVALLACALPLCKVPFRRFETPDVDKNRPTETLFRAVYPVCWKLIVYADLELHRNLGQHHTCQVQLALFLRACWACPPSASSQTSHQTEQLPNSGFRTVHFQF